MKTLTSLLLTLALSFTPGRSQDRNFILLGEGRGQEVRLFFMPEVWYKNLEGFEIKRREVGTSNWTTVTKSPILPGINKNKDLQNCIINNQNFLLNATNQGKAMIENAQLNEMSAETFKSEMSIQEKAEFFSLFFNRDFVIALHAGLGFIESNLQYKPGTEIEYGLFTLENGITGSIPANTFQFQVGSQPHYPLGAELNAEQTGHKVKLNWQVPKDQYKSYRILNGFHIDKKLSDGEVLRLSEHPIWMKTGEKKGSVIFNDKIEDQQQIHYILRAVTIFNTETAGEEFPFTPKKQIDFSSFSPKLVMNSMGENYEEGIEFIWSDSIYLNMEVDRFILQRKESISSSWENIESDLDPNIFYYTYKENLAEEQNYYFRIVIVLKNNRELWSNQVRVYKKKE